MGLKFDGVATSEHIDSSGEVLWLKGHDISDFNEGKGVFNFEHENSRPDDIIGKVVSAKKIFTKKDCDNDRERKFWDLTKKPFLYVVGELFDDELHPGSIALAAMMRHYAKNAEKILVGMSIEGQTLDREGQNLNRTIGRRIAMTLRPCNKACVADILHDPSTKDFVEKSFGKTESKKLIEVDNIILNDILDIEKPLDLVAMAVELEKTLTAGGYDVAPSQLVGGSALQVEHNASKRNTRNKFKAVVRDWDRKRPLKEYLKAAMPEVDDKYIDHFTELTDEIHLKKGETPLIRIDSSHSPNKNQDIDQQNLINGIHWDHMIDVPNQGGKNHVIKLQNDNGGHVIVKYPYKSDRGSGFENAQNSTIYHDMAKNFFGLGDNVPTTTYFNHPEHNKAMGDFNDKMKGKYSEDKPFHNPNGKLFSAMAFQDNASTIYDPKLGVFTGDMTPGSVLDQNHKNGTMEKLMMLDYLMGHTDRAMVNTLASNDGKMIHIDNDEALEYDEPASHPYIEHFGLEGQSMHPEASKWLNSLDPSEMSKHMKYHGADFDHTEMATDRLNMLKAASQDGALWEDIDNHMPRKEDYE